MANDFGHGKEFIHGNRDGPGGLSDTYTICRVGVPRRRIAEEIRAELHPKYHLIKVNGVCYPRNNPNTKAIDNVSAPSGGWTCPAHSARLTEEGSLTDFVANGQSDAKKMEFIHAEPGPRGEKRAYTICRLGVPRRLIVKEITAGLHPEYRLVRGQGGYRPWPIHPTDNWRCCMVAT